MLYSMGEKMKILMSRRNINQKELAEKLGISQVTLSKKFKLDDFRESDVKEIAKALDAEFEGRLILNDTKEVI